MLAVLQLKLMFVTCCLSEAEMVLVEGLNSTGQGQIVWLVAVINRRHQHNNDGVSGAWAWCSGRVDVQARYLSRHKVVM
jgi:hypothetical protein